MPLEEIDYLFMDGNAASSVFVRSVGRKRYSEMDSDDMNEEAKCGVEVVMKERK